ncbi:hypothetical protein SAY87_005972 [Trapa incisa]|uniref:F-box domain-containing protein n=1 Tax=Trapa incisa TaxID=236973 RepID=A0AAN7K6Z2_9MYRT|nr:hypothetical protein SAY87_005972 [Trapa incisa]
MWSDLPFHILDNVFSFLSVDSLARAHLACRNWHLCATSYLASPLHRLRRGQPPWFLALPSRGRGLSCYAHNPATQTWCHLSLDFFPEPVRPAASIGASGILLLRPSSSVVFKLAICNPFTRQLRYLPAPGRIRTNPALGVVVLPGLAASGSAPGFKIYVAGGMSDGGASYEPTLEVYESSSDTWRMVGSMPVEFAVRLTVWAPNESVHVGGSLYWVTSARAYSLMAFEIGSGGRWRELAVPFADRLEFAGLVEIGGRLVLVGAMFKGPARLWRLEGGSGGWKLITEAPAEMGERLLGRKPSWASVKCVGIEGAACLYRDIESGMIVWREVEEEEKRWEWSWVEGCSSIRGRKIHNFAVRGVFLHPNLSPSIFP